jgi:hypothetical protein
MKRSSVSYTGEPSLYDPGCHPGGRRR